MAINFPSALDSVLKRGLLHDGETNHDKGGLAAQIKGVTTADKLVKTPKPLKAKDRRAQAESEEFDSPLFREVKEALVGLPDVGMHAVLSLIYELKTRTEPERNTGTERKIENGTESLERNTERNLTKAEKQKAYRKANAERVKEQDRIRKAKKPE